MDDEKVENKGSDESVVRNINSEFEEKKLVKVIKIENKKKNILSPKN